MSSKLIRHNFELYRFKVGAFFLRHSVVITQIIAQRACICIKILIKLITIILKDKLTTHL